MRKALDLLTREHCADCLRQTPARHMRKRTHLMRPRRRIRLAHITRIDLIDMRDSKESHVDDQLIFENLEHSHQTVFAARP